MSALAKKTSGFPLENLVLFDVTGWAQIPPCELEFLDLDEETKAELESIKATDSSPVIAYKLMGIVNAGLGSGLFDQSMKLDALVEFCSGVVVSLQSYLHQYQTDRSLLADLEEVLQAFAARASTPKEREFHAALRKVADSKGPSLFLRITECIKTLEGLPNSEFQKDVLSEFDTMSTYYHYRSRLEAARLRSVKEAEQAYATLKVKKAGAEALNGALNQLYHHAVLNQSFVKGALAFGKVCLQLKRLEEPQIWLTIAVQIDECNQDVKSLLKQISRTAERVVASPSEPSSEAGNAASEESS
jgi:hypothetical protein